MRCPSPPSHHFPTKINQPKSRVATQVALCLIDLKLARLAHQPDHLDSMVDIAGYAAVLREVSR